MLKILHIMGLYGRDYMDVSIVSGTYNRLDYLKDMVDSVRSSIDGGLKYEIVLVDGGSKDGTIEWCKEQEDISIIEQGKLVGAVKAFNEGFKHAKGKYVIIANDDITFIGYSILHAYTYMQEHPQVGIGCFKQDRYGDVMRVAHMPAVLKQESGGKQVSVYYGQVCIVPRWLGDKVGWWGDYGAYTYGGDNELSANVIEEGYKVSPLPCACIHDMVADDELRDKNRGDPRKHYTGGGKHPDTELWIDRWTSDLGVGPVIPDSWKTDTVLDRDTMRIFYAPIFEPNHPFQKETKVTLRKELKKRGDVFEFDYMSRDLDDILDVAYCYAPDLFVLQIQHAGKLGVNYVRELKHDHPDAKFFLWNGDYHPKNLTSSTYIELLQEFDLCGFVTTEFHRLWESHGVNWQYIQAGYEEWYDETRVEDFHYDFVFLGNGYSEKRNEMADVIMNAVPEARVGLFGNWKNYDTEETLYDYRKNYEIYQSSRFAISDQQWPNAPGYVSDRLMHTMRSGTCVLQQWFKGMRSMMGLIDGENLLVWRDFNGLEELMRRVYSMPEDERKRIAKAGQEHIMEMYSYGMFVERMFLGLGI